MSARQTPASDEWQLGPEPAPDEHLEPPVSVGSGADLSAARLGRPLQVVTVEHVAWAAIALWALLTRFLELSAGPLAPAEARHALFEYDLANGTHWASAAGYHPAWSGWIHLLEAGLFAAGGASDVGARLIFVIAGLLMVVMAFVMRHYIGRAGAIALAWLIAISPTFTYFSRVSATGMAAAAMAMVAAAVFMALKRQATFLRAIGLGCASGLMAAADPAGLATGGIFLAALALLGVYQLLVTDKVYFRVRVWLERYASLLVATIIAAALSWCASELILFKLPAVGHSVEKLWSEIGVRDYPAAFHYYAPGMVLYEFLIALAGVAGMMAIVSLRAWSRFAFFSLLWAVMSFGYFLGSGERESEWLVQMLLPTAMVAAIGIDYMHHTNAWRYARTMLVVLGVATIYVQVLANFVYRAPDASEAPWARHANLYWREGATAIEAREHLGEIRRQFPEDGGTVFNSGIWPPAVRWYLRDFRPTNAANLADLVVNPNPPLTTGEDSEFETSYVVDLEESWAPTLTTLAPAGAIRFILNAAAWSTLQTRSIGITVRPRSDLAPTLIMPPGQSE